MEGRMRASLALVFAVLALVLVGAVVFRGGPVISGLHVHCSASDGTPAQFCLK